MDRSGRNHHQQHRRLKHIRYHQIHKITSLPIQTDIKYFAEQNMFFKIIVRKINLKYKYKKKQKFFYKFVYTTHVFAAKQESKIFSIWSRNIQKVRV